jgi:uncharacterized protein involved in exopolysaccharide biosynthesis
MEQENKSREIDVVGQTIKVLREKYSLCLFLLVFVVIGVVVALNTPKEYTSNVVLAPELSSGGLGVNSTLSDMASNFGIDLGNSKSTMDALYPEIYPDIFASNDFVIKLFNVPVRLKDKPETKTYYTHILSDNKPPFWAYPSMWLMEHLQKEESKKSNKPESKSNILELSKKDYGVCESIKNSISCIIDKKTSVITINVTDIDPMVSAIIADTLKNRLQEYITYYRTKKAKADIAYYDKLYKEARLSYETIQKKYAAYCDANQDVQLQSFISKRDELENEMQLKYNAYTQYSAQLQNAKAKLQEVTPAFTVIQDASVPIMASSTPRSFVVLLWAVIGILVDAIWVLLLKDKIFKSKGK